MGRGSRRSKSFKGHVNGSGRPKRLHEKTMRSVPMDKFGRLLEEVRKQQDELLDTLKKTYLVALADGDMRSRETEQIKSDLNGIYEVLERNRRAREQRISALIRCVAHPVPWTLVRREGHPVSGIPR